jgi:transcription termination/antitermination protein NusG
VDGEMKVPDRPTGDPDASPASTGSAWYALQTRSHCEDLVHHQLTQKGIHPFLPKIEAWSRRSGVRRRIQVPMFPGYLFVHHVMDKASCIEVRKARGVVRLLGERWDRLAIVPAQDIEAIQRTVGARLTVMPYPYLREGQRVRITDGPMADVEGILVRTRPNKGLLVLSVDLFQRSVAVELDCTRVVAA